MKLKLLKSLLLFGTFLCFGTAAAQELSGTVSELLGPYRAPV